MCDFAREEERVCIFCFVKRDVSYEKMGAARMQRLMCVCEHDEDVELEKEAKPERIAELVLGMCLIFICFLCTLQRCHCII